MEDWQILHDCVPYPRVVHLEEPMNQDIAKGYDRSVVRYSSRRRRFDFTQKVHRFANDDELSFHGGTQVWIPDVVFKSSTSCPIGYECSRFHYVSEKLKLY